MAESTASIITLRESQAASRVTPLLLLGPEDGGSSFLLSVGKLLTDYSVTSQKTILFTVTAMRTSSLITKTHI
jgi:hypothetical protein